MQVEGAFPDPRCDVSLQRWPRNFKSDLFDTAGQFFVPSPRDVTALNRPLASG